MKLFIIILVIIIILAALIGEIGYRLMVKKGDKGILVNNEKNLSDNQSSFEFPTSKLFDEKKYEDVYITVDNLKLHAYNFALDLNQPWVIIVHGYNGRAQSMSRQLDHFYNKNFNCLMVDLRSAGLSEGEYIALGDHEAHDIIGWIKYLNQTYNNPEIILYGESMGAATVMNTTGYELSDNVICAIEDCGFSSTWQQCTYELKNMFHLPAFPALHLTSLACKLHHKLDLRNGSPKDSVAHSKTPTLFIHGDSDTFVPFYMHDIVYNACSAKKDKLVIHNAGHIYSNIIEPDTYWNKVDSWIETNRKSRD